MEKEKDRSVTLSLDSRVYSLQAVKNAAYDFTGKAHFVISANHSKMEVAVSLKEPAEPDTIQDFLNHVLDHQVRVDLAKEFGLLREIIVAQAFDPRENLRKIVRIAQESNET